MTHNKERSSSHSCSAAMPGRTHPSRNSSRVPPPRIHATLRAEGFIDVDLAEYGHLAGEVGSFSSSSRERCSGLLTVGEHVFLCYTFPTIDAQVKHHYCATAADSRKGVDSGVAVPFLMVLAALIKARTNNQAATIATPASEIHIIQSATMGFVLLVQFVTI